MNKETAELFPDWHTIAKVLILLAKMIARIENCIDIPCITLENLLRE